MDTETGVRSCRGVSIVETVESAGACNCACCSISGSTGMIFPVSFHRTSRRLASSSFSLTIMPSLFDRSLLSTVLWRTKVPAFVSTVTGVRVRAEFVPAADAAGVGVYKRLRADLLGVVRRGVAPNTSEVALFMMPTV